MNNTNKVGFHNRNQVVLFEVELKGQISDGMWENASPRNHYMAPCSATAFVASNESEVGRNFSARKYNFSNSELLEIVGERMINAVKLSQAFPHVAVNDLPDIDVTVRSTLLSMERYCLNDLTGYWVKKLNKLKTVFGVDTLGELIILLESRMAAVDYTMTDLRRDLNDMKKCWGQASLSRGEA